MRGAFPTPVPKPCGRGRGGQGRRAGRRRGRRADAFRTSGQRLRRHRAGARAGAGHLEQNGRAAWADCRRLEKRITSWGRNACRTGRIVPPRSAWKVRKRIHPVRGRPGDGLHRDDAADASACARPCAPSVPRRAVVRSRRGFRSDTPASRHRKCRRHCRAHPLSVGPVEMTTCNIRQVMNANVFRDRRFPNFGDISSLRRYFPMVCPADGTVRDTPASRIIACVFKREGSRGRMNRRHEGRAHESLPGAEMFKRVRSGGGRQRGFARSPWHANHGVRRKPTGKMRIFVLSRKSLGRNGLAAAD